jgi:hypothetical protein
MTREETRTIAASSYTVLTTSASDGLRRQGIYSPEVVERLLMLGFVLLAGVNLLGPIASVLRRCLLRCVMELCSIVLQLT